ncbi:glycosyltransferase family A protein [Paracoccus sp. (in: a-proteobacteria)]|uniref:glycosyltransferase family 2 protein n=1 Tax=Paracoccus sp. TaxID=267 RepID=UPI0026E101CD|nr:glycosyltransferase family A protein [Paracoccus sp. (in: a-proteobacteria)]MDO5647656.1 glycosyltransferase family A protein [Paracoccus sp. (in: a-proteobacteria)]
MPNVPFDLTVIVPVHNARPHLAGLVDGLTTRRDLRVQVILIDDASTDGSGADIARMAEPPNVIGLALPENRGAGHARNLGWPQAQGRYTLFFDADDRLHDDVLAPVIAMMDADTAIDAAVLAYRYDRGAGDGFTAMGLADQRIFHAILNGQPHATGTLDQMPEVLGLTNYPWNKLIRTAHFRQAGLRFGKTRVNNDILGHWQTLMGARRILVADQVICTHIVHDGGANLTNRFGPERVQMFDALIETCDFLDHSHDRARYAHHFWGLVDVLVRWARPRLDAAALPEFETRYRDLIGRLWIEDLMRMKTQTAPDIAARLSLDLLDTR